MVEKLAQKPVELQFDSQSSEWLRKNGFSNPEIKEVARVLSAAAQAQKKTGEYMFEINADRIQGRVALLIDAAQSVIQKKGNNYEPVVFSVPNQLIITKAIQEYCTDSPSELKTAGFPGKTVYKKI